MTLRTLLFSTLRANATVDGFVHGRIIQASAMKEATVTKPYIVYHLGNNTNELLADDHPASRQFFQVYIHDEPGDYQQIDAIVLAVKASLVGLGSKPDGLITTRYLETSQDFNDETLRTIFRYIRFQFILSR
jgi:hypothetical protein